MLVHISVVKATGGDKRLKNSPFPERLSLNETVRSLPVEEGDGGEWSPFSAGLEMLIPRCSCCSCALLLLKLSSLAGIVNVQLFSFSLQLFFYSIRSAFISSKSIRVSQLFANKQPCRRKIYAEFLPWKQTLKMVWNLANIISDKSQKKNSGVFENAQAHAIKKFAHSWVF